MLYCKFGYFVVVQKEIHDNHAIIFDNKSIVMKLYDNTIQAIVMKLYDNTIQAIAVTVEKKKGSIVIVNTYAQEEFTV